LAIVASLPEFKGFLEATGPVTQSTIEQFGIEAATAEGIGFPPYHPHCHTVLEPIV